MQQPLQPPMNGQCDPPPPQGSGAPTPPQQQAPPPPPQYYQQYAPPPQQQYAPPLQYAPPPPQQYGPPPQLQYAPPLQYAQPPQQQYAPPLQYAQPPQQYAPPPQQQYAPPLQYAQPPQQYAPPPQEQDAPPPQYAQPPQYGTTPGNDEVRTLWIGDLQYWMDENYLHYNAFAPVAQQITSVKIIRNKQTVYSKGYGFIEFYSRAAAEHTLMTFNGQMMPNSEMVNWASDSSEDKRGDSGSDYTIFVGDLSPFVTDSMLENVFKANYPSFRGAKVVFDKITGCPKGYGFVHFGDVNEWARAMTEMNGVMLSSRKMRLVAAAADKKNTDAQQTYATNGAYQSSQGNSSENDPNNTTVFVGGLDSNVNEEYLRQIFTPYGEISYVKILVGKDCGFVQFTSRPCAEEAIQMLNGSQIGGHKVRLSWGRSSQNRQASQQDAYSQYNGNSYYGYRQQGYEGYGYGAPNTQDPSVQNYYGYPGYGNYEQQQPTQEQQQQQQPPPPRSSDDCLCTSGAPSD